MSTYWLYRLNIGLSFYIILGSLEEAVGDLHAMHPDYTISRSSLCNKLRPVGPLPHWFLFYHLLRQGMGRTKSTTQYNICFFIGGGFIEGVAYLVFRPILGYILFTTSSDLGLIKTT